MELEELIALLAAPIYAAFLVDHADKRDGAPSEEWKKFAISVAVADAKLLWEGARTEARKGPMISD